LGDAQSVTASTSTDNLQAESERLPDAWAENAPAKVAADLRAMNPAAVPASMGTVDSAGAVEQLDSSVDASTVTLPAVRMQVNARGLALGILATLATVFALSWAQGFVIPLLLGIVISYMVNPLVNWLELMKIPRVVGTIIVMASILGALIFGTYSLRAQMQTIVAQLPEAAATFATGLARMRISEIGNLRTMQSAAAEVERATTQETADPAARRQRATHVIVDQPAFKVDNFLWKNSLGALGVIGQAAMVLFLVFFLLLGGGTFKRKLVRLTGPSLSKRKIAVRILDDINDSIQKYMLMLLTTNLLVGLLTWIAFRLFGLENAGAWAAAAALAHIVPYLGPGVTAVATGMAAFMQFQSIPTALLVAGSSLAIATLVGIFVTTWMAGRIAHMNSAAVFISLLFWGWLWGVWGMLLSIPIIVIVKIVSRHVEQLHGMAELLGD
jgi:predicted PurR-regulated permease PerM